MIVVQVSDMEQNPHTIPDDFFQMFDHATRRELIALTEFLTTEQVAAWTANDAMQAAAIEELFHRIENLLERIDQREVRTAIRAAEVCGVN